MGVKKKKFRSNREVRIRTKMSGSIRSHASKQELLDIQSERKREKRDKTNKQNNKW